MPHLKIPVAACLLLTSATALAQAVPETAAVVVTATRTGEGAASATSIVRAADIERLQSLSLVDALNNVAGVRAVSTGGTGGGSFVSIRGGEPNFTLVLVDGVRVNDPTNTKGGAFDFTLIDPSLVETIEVSRGATSAVHGSDALSGVINIRLREPAANASEALARVQGGTRGEVGGGGTGRFGWADGGLLLGGAAFDSNDADKGSTLRRQQGLARVSQRIGDFDAVALGLYARSDRSAFPEDSGGPRLAVNRAREDAVGDLVTAALSLRHRPEGVVRPHASVSYSRQTSDVDTPFIAPGTLDAVPAIVADNRLERVEAIGDVVVDLGALAATVGGAWLEEDGRSLGAVDFGAPVPTDFRLERRTLSGFVEATLRPAEGLTLNGAARHDRVDGGPKEWTGRAAVSWTPLVGGPALFGRWGEGFKLPSFYALGSPLIGNPDLAPERSRNLEAGVEWSATADTAIRVALFHNRFRDLIDFDSETFSSVNRASVRARGVEAEASWRPVPAVALAGAVTHVDLDAAVPLRARPRWQGNLRANWRVVPDLEVGGQVRLNGDFFDSSIPTGLIRQDGQATLDANLRYAFSPGLRLDVALRNIGDVDAREAVGFPSLGRTLRATLTARLF